MAPRWENKKPTTILVHNQDHRSVLVAAIALLSRGRAQTNEAKQAHSPVGIRRLSLSCRV